MAEANSIYHDLAAVLRERLAVIGDREFYQKDPVGHLERLKLVSSRMLKLQALLPEPMDPQLSHYLQRCSYDKALALLEARL
ncbi:MAG TPA: hypothetical protein VF593_05995 [Chthoniobacteraceae bacterium]